MNGGSHLDSHANMIVFGKHCYVIANSGHTAEGHVFTEDVGIGSMKRVPIIDDLILYECPYTGKIFILVERNVFYTPSMDHNLIPPFVLRQAGLVVNDTPKIHCDRPTKYQHAIIHSKSGLHIRLQLEGVFFVFERRKPTLEEVLNNDATIVNITPEGASWDLSTEIYELNEDAHVDRDGDIIK